MWYKEGLRFKCTGCGGCCTGAPGFVWLTQDDITQLAKALNLSEEAFVRRYTRQVGPRLSLLEDETSFDCVFLKGKRCTVYEARPEQCRKFPWWPMNLKSEREWQQAAKSCEGIDHPEAPLISASEIERLKNS